MPETPVQYPEVVEAVKKEIKAAGDNIKQIHDSMLERHNKLTSKLDTVAGKVDAIDKAFIMKCAEDVTLKQETLDKALITANARMDALDATLTRTHKGANDASDKKLVNEAIEFKKTQFVVANRAREIADMDIENVDTKELEAYNKAFATYLRKGGLKDMPLSPEVVKALSVGSDPDGGLLVTPAISANIITRIFESDPIRSLANIETIGTDALEIFLDDDEVDDGWETETVANAETKTPQLGKKRIPVFWQSARPKATQQLLDDASRNIENWLTKKVSDKFARTEAAAFVNGNGVGRPRGFLTYSAWASEGVYEVNKIEQVNSGAAANVTADGLKKLMFHLIEDYLIRATWFMNRLTVMEVSLLKDGMGNYLWRPGMEAGSPSTIFSVPVRMSTTMPVVAANALSVAIADWSKAYTIVDRMGISVQRDPYTVKPSVEYYTRRRVGGDVTDFAAIKIGKCAA